MIRILRYGEVPNTEIFARAVPAVNVEKVVADVIRFLLSRPDVSGIVHGTCEDQCTWYDLTVELFRLMGLKREVVPCTTEEFPRPAPRPRNSALKKSVLNLLGYRTPRWQDALRDFVAAPDSGLMT